MLCSLCGDTTRPYMIFQDRSFVRCINCKAILLSTEYYLTSEAEKSRYELHNNDVQDKGYIEFVTPIVDQIKVDFDNSNYGLDFGCGTGPVISSELEKSGYDLELYDPYFEPSRVPLKKKYDFIVCCEVMEHFQNSYKEFKLLKSLLKKEARLYCKTEIFRDEIDFSEWHYKNDPTHVIFYHPDTLGYIQSKFGFRKLEIKSDFLVFSN